MGYIAGHRDLGEGSWVRQVCFIIFINIIISWGYLTIGIGLCCCCCCLVVIWSYWDQLFSSSSSSSSPSCHFLWLYNYFLYSHMDFSNPNIRICYFVLIIGWEEGKSFNKPNILPLLYMIRCLSVIRVYIFIFHSCMVWSLIIPNVHAEIAVYFSYS